MELSYSTASESEEEDAISNLVDQFLESIREVENSVDFELN